MNIVSVINFDASSMDLPLYASDFPFWGFFPQFSSKCRAQGVDLAYVIWTGLEVCATEGIGTICLLVWWLCHSLCLDSPVLSKSLRFVKKIVPVTQNIILKYYLLFWWEITLRLMLWFVFINSEPGASVPLPGWRRKEQKRWCRPQGDDGLAVKAACRHDKRSHAKKPCEVLVEATCDTGM